MAIRKPEILLGPSEKFIVTVTRVRNGRVMDHQYLPIGEEPEIGDFIKNPTGKTKTTYGYVDVEVDAELEQNIFRQEVEKLDLSKLISAVNGL